MVELKNLRFLIEDRDESDRRRIHLSITEKGLEVFKKSEHKRKEFLLDAFHHIEIHKARVLIGLLGTLIKI